LGYDEYNRSCYRVYDPLEQKAKRIAATFVTFREDVLPGRKIDLTYPVEIPLEVLQSVGGAVGFAPVPAVPKIAADRAHEGAAQPAAVPAQPPAVVGAGDPGRLWDPGGEEDEQLGRGLRQRRSNLCVDPSCPDRGVHRAHVVVSSHYAFAAAASISRDPGSYKEAMRCPDNPKWRRAMDEELAALEANNTWTLCVLPPGANLISSRWVYKTKLNERGEVVRYKARFVVKGFSQQWGRDYWETFAPVARLDTIRVIFALVAELDLELHNMDVDNAFVQAELDDEEVVYVKQPEGYERRGPNGEMLVCKLRKSLYGLKQAPFLWHERISAWLEFYGLEPIQSDPCVYVQHEPESGIVLAVALYVDDLLIAGLNLDVVNEFKRAISAAFKVKDMGELRWMLGMEVIRDRAKQTLMIRQTSYIDQVLARFGMSDCRPVDTPIQGVLTRLEDGEPDCEYSSIVGSLLYAAIVTRPDISYAVHVLGRHVQSEGDEHRKAAKRVLRYLQGTRELGITYGGGSAEKDPELVGYSDADDGGDVNTRLSTSAYVFMLAGGCISWASKLQRLVTLSTAESEYVALSLAVQEAIYLRQLVNELGCDQQSITIYEDNQACISIASTNAIQSRTKHIDKRYHFIRQHVASGEVKMEYIPSNRQLADLLTKPLTRDRVDTLRRQILGIR
jgi:hypothetical protein